MGEVGEEVHRATPASVRSPVGFGFGFFLLFGQAGLIALPCGSLSLRAMAAVERGGRPARGEDGAAMLRFAGGSRFFLIAARALRFMGAGFSRACRTLCRSLARGGVGRGSSTVIATWAKVGAGVTACLAIHASRQKARRASALSALWPRLRCTCATMAEGGRGGEG